MELIHDRLLNNQFAPGIATYGIDGKDGKSGQAGTSFYFTSYSLENKTQQDECLVKINRNMVLSEFVDVQLQRKYAIGDLILDTVGRIYKIVQKNGQFALDYVSSVVGLDSSSFVKESGNNRLFLDASFDGLDIIQGNEDNSLVLDNTSSDSILRIANTKEDSKSGKLNILQFLSKPSLSDSKYLNVSYDKTSEAFSIESNTDIMIDSSLVEVKSDNSRSTLSLGNYYKITPYNDPIGLVHLMLSEASWNVIDNKIVISGIDNTPITSLGLRDNFYVKVKKENEDIIFDWNPQYYSEDGITGQLVTNIDDTGDPSVSVIRGIEVFIPKN